jgi:GNAT superfamily N-acetyltransferase
MFKWASIEDGCIASVKSVIVKTDEITDSISQMFDYEFTGTSTFTSPVLPKLPNQYRIGLIVGPSGSGKSTLLSQFGKSSALTWEEDKAICSHFSNAEDAQEKLNAVGFNSIPSWMRPYHVLSMGERFRADLARQLVSGALIDEFTSVVDRNVARSCAVAVRRYADANDLNKMVFASCHYDIIEWLQPDWIFDTMTNEYTYPVLRRRPEIKLELVPCTTRAWQTFRDHHYLDGNINQSSRCWIAIWDNSIVGFASAISFPSGSVKNAWREHRTVVAPDFQGMGLGVRISDAVAEIFHQEGCRFFSKTAHPRMGGYRERSSLWKATSKNMRNRQDYKADRQNKEAKYKDRHADRLCFSHEYIGGNR